MAGAQSNPTRRVIAVLDFLAQRSSRTFSLTDLSRELGISKSTLHPLVETLVEAGYLMREADVKRIRLGPVLTGIGQAALGRRGHLIDMLRPAMESVARELNANCVVSADFGEWIVPLAAAGDPPRVTTLFRVGARSNPFSPPLGLLFLPGRSMSEIHEWLDRAQPPLDSTEVELSLSALDLLRTNGFAATTRLDVKARIETAFDGFYTPPNVENTEIFRDLMEEMRRARYLILDFAQPQRQEVDWIGIPILDDAGRVELAFVVLNLPGHLNGPEILDIAQLMQASVSRIPGVRLLTVSDGASVRRKRAR